MSDKNATIFAIFNRVEFAGNLKSINQDGGILHLIVRTLCIILISRFGRVAEVILL